MSGLLEKDICLLLRGHRNMLILFFMICVFLGLGQPGTFILGYLPSLMLVVLIGTFSCDESDNGFPFLFTLPIDRKTYIQEKYVFCVGGTVVSFAIAWMLYMASQVLHGVSNLSGLLLENAGMIPVFMAVFFGDDPGADQIWSRKCTGSDGGNLLFLCRCGSVCAENCRRSDAGSDRGAAWHHHGKRSWTGGNFCGKHRSCADFVWDQCKIYGETGDLEKFKDAGFHVCM